MKRIVFTCFPLCLLFFSACKKPTLFQLVSDSHSGIDFTNTIIETDTVNIMDFSNVYNGGGVGIGDFNNDGLQDVYFTGNMVSNKLYINKGDFKFEDVTAKAKVDGAGKWCRGVSVVDINNDGLQDIYVCATIWKEKERRENLLYINKGVDKDGVPIFEESAKAYGLNDDSYSTSAAFFDYDNDGDLDVFISVNQILEDQYPNKFRPLQNDGSFPSTSRLYRNEGSDSLGHPYFKNVSAQAGITYEGYSHGATIVDLNNDGWKDIYVTNDYLSPNVLYINNRNGTFTNMSKQYFKHTSANSMGQDIVDLNNDGLEDVFELDMNPEDNYRKKLMMNPGSYQTYQNSDYFGYQYQYVRNTLQLNQGYRVENDTVGAPAFSEISFLSHVAETDWSWTPLIADFDNDGYRDIIITNGFPKDVTDHDFVAFRNQAYAVATKQDILKQIPEVKIPNYAFHNGGNLVFEDRTKDWGLNTPSFTNGAAYADLDNDGDLDLVFNNINDKAFVYRNTANDEKQAAHYINIQLMGPKQNIQGLGAKVNIFYNRQQQVFENTPFRGYLSSIQKGIHFGLGNNTAIDSIRIVWPDGKKQLLQQVNADQQLTVKYADANSLFDYSADKKVNTLLSDVTKTTVDTLADKDDDFIDFNIQKLLPHKLSDYGPALAVGDVNGDKIDDIVMGGGYGYPTKILLQQKDGRFKQQLLQANASRISKPSEDMGILLFDADGDGDNDLYIASGGYQMDPNTNHYADLFYVNDGKGNFSIDSAAFPTNYTSKSCVRATDIDNDGDLDLFVAGRCLPYKYPSPVSCFILRNDTRNGKVKFTDVTAEVAPQLKDIGMTCDALFTDFNNDGTKDLVLAGEFMPVTFLANKNGKFTKINTALDQQVGWYNSITAGDFDNDGDIDYIAGNTGDNSFYRPTDKYPVTIYGGDFDNNGNFDAIPTVYLKSIDGTLKEYVAHTRDDLIKQMIEMRTKFKTYREFATADFDKFLSPEQLKNAIVLKANNLHSIYIQNDGDGKFEYRNLPIQAQFSSLFGMLAEDVDGDGNLDVVINGNDYGTEVSTGRYDALNGLVLKGDGKGNFLPLSIMQSGLFIPGNGKALVQFVNAKGSISIAASQNNGPLKVYTIKAMQQSLPVNYNDSYTMLQLQNGKTRKVETYIGSGFLSQSSPYIASNKSVVAASVYNMKNVPRKINLQP